MFFLKGILFNLLVNEFFFVDFSLFSDNYFYFCIVVDICDSRYNELFEFYRSFDTSRNNVSKASYYYSSFEILIL